MAADATANSYTLDIYGTTSAGVNFSSCGHVIGNNTSVSSSTWTWVDSKQASETGTASKVDIPNLPGGSYTMRMSGTEAGVKLDKIMLIGVVSGNSECTPTSTGDNCEVLEDTSPPIASITSPVGGLTVANPIKVTVDARDAETGISKVEFFVHAATAPVPTTPTQTVTTASAPNTYEYTLPNKPEGSSQKIFAKVYNNGSPILVTTLSTITINVKDVTEPAVSITSPTGTISGNATVVATATDNVAVKEVRFFTVNSGGTEQFINTDTVKSGTNQYDVPFATSSRTDGDYKLRAYVEDTAGNVKRSADIDITIDNVSPPDTVNPSISITRPTNNATISDTYRIDVTATDNDQVAYVEYFIDGSATPVATRTAAPFSYNLDTTVYQDNSTHQIVAKAFDRAGNNAQSTSVSFKVSNPTAIPEDIDMQGCVGFNDFSILAGDYDKTTISNPRSNIDGVITGGIHVNLGDFSRLASKYDANCDN